MITKTDIERLNKDYAAFEKACEFWIDKIGLTDWKISIKQLSPIEEKDTLAMATYNVSQKKALIEFLGTLDEETCSMPELALHEVLHIVIAPALDSRQHDDRENHAILRRLIPLLLPLYPAELKEEKSK